MHAFIYQYYCYGIIWYIDYYYVFLWLIYFFIFRNIILFNTVLILVSYMHTHVFFIYLF